MTMKTAKRPGDVPEGNHYAIITFKTVTVHIPGDERSRTNPGHGYPAHDEEYSSNEYKWTYDKAEWAKEIEYLERAKHTPYHETYAAIEVLGKAKVETKIIIK